MYSSNDKESDKIVLLYITVMMTVLDIFSFITSIAL